METTPASKAAIETPTTLCLKLPGISLGELNKQPRPRAKPISKLPTKLKTAMGRLIEILRITALEKSGLLRYFNRSLK